MCEQQEHKAKRAKYAFEEKVREKYLYRGNRDLKDKIDLAVVDYMRKNRLYVEVINVAHGLYIIGGGYSVKAQMAGDRLLVSDGPNNTATNFIRVEKHIQQNSPEDWERLQFFRERLHPETVI